MVLFISFCREIDAFINFSLSEGLPVGIMEAMECGIPVIATDVGGVSEIVKDSVNGRLISPFLNSKELSKEIVNYLSNSNLNDFSKRSREIYLSEFNDEKNYKEFICIIKSV